MGCVKRTILIGLALFLLLTERVSAGDRQDARDHATCIGEGAEEGTDEYKACRSELTAKHKAQAEANMENYRQHVGR